jgi:hypothetical protein
MVADPSFGRVVSVLGVHDSHAAVTNRMYRYGPAGLGSLGYYPVPYPGFTVRPP